MNCAGGATPWGSWLTCEETVNGPDVGLDFTGADNSLLDRRHGYVFEVPVAWGPNEYRQPKAIRAAGRFAHEAVDIDPATGILYETEDNFGFPPGFYRYIAPRNPMEVGGAALFSRLEGIFFDSGKVYLVSTQGGDTPDGEPAPRGFGSLV